LTFYDELKRRNVLRVGAAYVVAAWLLIQVVETIFPLFGFDETPARVVVIILAICFVPVLVFSWAFELTPDGLKKESEVDRNQSITPSTGKQLDRMIMVVLALALGYFAFDKFVLDPIENRQIVQTALEQERTSSPVESYDSKSIAVLPFINRSQLQDDQYFTDGMHDELLTRLAHVSALKVISRTSVMRYRDTIKSIPEIAKELSVASILEGGVQRVGSQVRVNVQLIDTQTDEHLWAEIFDRELTAENLFVIQSDISKAIARILKARLTQDESQALEQIPTESLAAYDAYITGRTSLNSLAQTDLESAVEQFTRATRLDPGFASAWAGLCEANLSLYTQNSDSLFYENAERACKQALELDDSRVDVHVALAALYRNTGLYSRAEVSMQLASYKKAEQAVENALNINSLSVEALLEHGRVLAAQNRLQEAEAELLQAEALQPDQWVVQLSLFNFYYRKSDRSDRYELAARHAERAAAIRPDLAASWNNLGAAKYMLQQYDQASDAWQQSLAIEPTRTAYTNSGLALFDAGQYEESAVMQEKAVALAPKDHRSWGRLAETLSRIDGQTARAREINLKASELAIQKLEVNDQDWRTLALLATYQARTGETEQAVMNVQRALSLSGRHAEALLFASEVYIEAEEIDTYLSLLEEMVARDASFRQFINIDNQEVENLERFQAIVAKP
jgi:TolB-like protein/cytochrome c-type biogenesis protein CcmH/NrfG